MLCLTDQDDVARITEFLDSGTHDFDYEDPLFHARAKALLSREMAWLGWLDPASQVEISSLAADLVTRLHTMTLKYEMREPLTIYYGPRSFGPIFSAVSPYLTPLARHLVDFI